jgi:hypothetical protein
MERDKNRHMKASPVTSVVPPWRSPPEAFVPRCDEVHV